MALKFIALFLLLLPCVASAQKKFLLSLDTTYQPINDYISTYDKDTYFSYSLGEHIINVLYPDTHLLNAALYFTINKWRIKKGREAYSLNGKLQRLCEAHTEKYHASRFDRNVQNSIRIKKLLRKFPRYHGLRFKLLDGATGRVNIVDYKRGRFFFHRKDEETTLKLFKGSKAALKDTSKVLKPLGELTYNQFADRAMNELLKGSFGKTLRSRSYELIGINIRIDARSVNRNEIPQAKIIVLVGGHRNKLLLQVFATPRGGD